MENAELGRKVLDQIDARPETLYMGAWGYGSCEPGEEWACGTVACLAGHAMLAAGYSLRRHLYYRPDGTRVNDEAGEAAVLLGFRDGEARVFHDMAGGPARFREMVEKAEKRQADEGRMV